MRTLAILTVVFAATHCIPFSGLEATQWNNFKLKHGKTYATPEEENLRQNIYLKNLKEFEEHNAKYEAGLVSYTKGVNRFADLTKEEFVKLLTPFNLSEVAHPKEMYVPPVGIVDPDEGDWRKKGAVTFVKDQGSCGSCWSLSVTDALEGQLFIKTGNLISQQNLIDCSFSVGNRGCRGGMPDRTYNYIKHNGGIDTEKSYPYEGVDNNGCRYNPKNFGGTANGGRYVEDNEDALKSAVANVGPISVAINADLILFYKGGIVDEPNCDSMALNHAVLAVASVQKKPSFPYLCNQS